MPAMKTDPTPGEIRDDVARRWSRVLKITDEPKFDDFFQLGGTSFMALQLLTEIEENLGVSIPLMAFAQQPTLKGLLDMLRVPSTVPAPSLVPLQPRGEKVPFFLVHAEAGHVYFAQNLADLLGPDQPMYGLQSRGLDGREAPLATMQEMAKHYVKCLKTVQPVGPYRLGGFCTGAFLALAMTNQLQDAGEEVSHLAIFSTDAAWRNVARIADLNYHRREMAGIGLTDGIRYLATRIRFRLHRIYSNGVFYLRRLYALRGKELPARLRYVYIAELNYRGKYPPAKPGALIL